MKQKLKKTLISSKGCETRQSIPADFSLSWYDVILIFLLSGFALFLQQNMYCQTDGAWHVEGAGRLLNGATFSNGLFDDNLLMNYVYFIPAVLAHHVLAIPKMLAVNGFIYLCVLISFFMSDYCLQKILVDKRKSFFVIFRYSLLFLLFYFPMNNFAGRDVRVVFFLLPIIFLWVVNLSKEPVGFLFRGFVGFWAFLGVACNPFYLLAPLALMLCAWYQRKKMVYLETGVLSGLFLFYCIGIGIFYPDFYTVIIPAFLVFSPAFNATWQELLLNQVALIVAISLILPVFSRDLMQNSKLMKTCWMMLAIGYGVYLLHQKWWPAHLMFPLAFAFLLWVAIFCECFFIRLKKMRHYWVGFIALCFIFFAEVLTISTFNSMINAFHDKKSERNQVIAYFNALPKQTTFYAFSTVYWIVGDITSATQVVNMTPWPNDWMLQVFARHQVAVLAGWKREMAYRYEAIFIKRSVSDLKNQKPAYVLFQYPALRKNFSDYPINYFYFLQKSPEFLIVWKHYQFAKKILDYRDGKLVATYLIYKRIS